MASLTRPIVLLTDYGMRDTYVGQVKNVLASTAPASLQIDLTHEVEPFAIDEGAWMLETALPVIPQDAVVLAVVDPGVGTSRRPLVVRRGGRHFVGPDNGLLSPAFPVESRRALSAPQPVPLVLDSGFDVREIHEPQFRRPTVSNTFHGRDVFAPTAALIASGVDYRQAGPPLSHAIALPECCAAPHSLGEAAGYVVHIDRYGNLITTIRASQLFPSFELEIEGTVVDQHVRTFGDARGDAPFCHIDSSGFVAIAVKYASAAEKLGVRRGAKVTVRAR